MEKEVLRFKIILYQHKLVSYVGPYIHLPSLIGRNIPSTAMQVLHINALFIETVVNVIQGS